MRWLSCAPASWSWRTPTFGCAAPCTRCCGACVFACGSFARGFPRPKPAPLTPHPPPPQSHDFQRAATVLALARLDSPGVQLDTAGRARAWLNIAQAYLQAEDEVTADRYVKRCGDCLLRLAPGMEPKLRLEYGAAAAQLLDARKRFLEASLKYGEVARLLAASTAGYNKEEVVVLLEKAVRCALLAPPGPQRARAMAMLMRDENIGGLSVRAALCSRSGGGSFAPAPLPLAP